MQNNCTYWQISISELFYSPILTSEPKNAYWLGSDRHFCLLSNKMELEGNCFCGARRFSGLMSWLLKIIQNLYCAQFHATIISSLPRCTVDSKRSFGESPNKVCGSSRLIIPNFAKIIMKSQHTYTTVMCGLIVTTNWNSKCGLE